MRDHENQFLNPDHLAFSYDRSCVMIRGSEVPVDKNENSESSALDETALAAG